MTDEKKNALIALMTDNVSMLRVRLNLTQVQLAELIGLSRYTLMAIEKKQRKMTWSAFLSLLLVFSKNQDTAKLLETIGIYTEQLNDYLELRSITTQDRGDNK